MIQGLCSNEATPDNFNCQFLDFNSDPIINRQTNITYYPNSPGMFIY